MHPESQDGIRAAEDLLGRFDGREAEDAEHTEGVR
jgi:hypothetical protein